MLTSLVLLLGLSVSSADALPWLSEAPPQLNVPGFARCLAEREARFDLPALKREHRIASTDFLLLYLSVYPGVRLPGLGFVQDRAQARWTGAWEEREAALAASMLTRDRWLPGVLWNEALRACPAADIFCAALISHNVLRTLGRHERASYRDRGGRIVNLNPRWFREHEADWLERIPLVQKSLISLRADGGGDRWGEWYHFFGLLTFATHEVAREAGMSGVDVVARLNEVLNPILAGGQEEPEKARLDRDTVEVAARYLTGAAVEPGPACDTEEAYVVRTGGTDRPRP